MSIQNKEEFQMMQEYSVTTKMTYEQAKTILEAKLSEVKFGVLCKLDLPEKFKEKGLSYERKFTIFEVCNPNEAVKVLTVDPKAAYFLPCKIVVHEKDGMAVVGMIRPTSMIIDMHNPDLDGIAQQIEEKLISVMDSMI
jgi:uncharacterized protein (DUF302 family)